MGEGVEFGIVLFKFGEKKSAAGMICQLRIFIFYFPLLQILASEKNQKNNNNNKSSKYISKMEPPELYVRRR